MSQHDGPIWARWTYLQKYLPKDFHCKQGIEKLGHWINQQHDTTASPAVVLAVGLALRDVVAVQNKRQLLVPEHVMVSPFGKKHEDRLLEFCDIVLSTLTGWDDEAAQSEMPVAGPSGHSAPSTSKRKLGQGLPGKHGDLEDDEVEDSPKRKKSKVAPVVLRRSKRKL